MSLSVSSLSASVIAVASVTFCGTGKAVSTQKRLLRFRLGLTCPEHIVLGLVMLTPFVLYTKQLVHKITDIVDNLSTEQLVPES